MLGTGFEKPVNVLVGLGFPRKVTSADEAYQLLSDMRPAAGVAAHKMALRACKAAIHGEIDPEIARSAFAAFARRHAMLLSEDTAEGSALREVSKALNAKPRAQFSLPRS